jgi:DNA polymerase-3 subunit beta
VKQLVINSAALVPVLRQAAGLIAPNPILPILENVLIQVEKGQVTLFSSNQEAQFSILVPCDTLPTDDFQICLPAKLLQTILSNLPTQALTFNIDLDTHAAELRASKGRYRIAGENAIDWPRPRPTPAQAQVVLEGAILANALNATMPFVWPDSNSRPEICGVMLRLFADGLVHLAATDGHRVSQHSFRTAATYTPRKFILPTQVAKQLAALASKSKTVTLELGEWMLAAPATGDWSFSARLVEGNFPDYENVMPLNNPNGLLLQRGELLQALRRISAFANPTTNQVLLTLCEGEELRLSAESTEYGNDADERMACEYTGEEQQVCFNVKYLEQSLAVLPSDEIRITMSTPSRPALLSVAVPGEEQPVTDVLLMPVVPIVAY